jgi:hypothetical protein
LLIHFIALYYEFTNIHCIHNISSLSAELKTDIIAVEDNIIAVQKQLKNNIQAEINATKKI